jgi:chromate transport protein ChrA
MNEQNFKNHVRYLTIWHFILPTLVMLVFVSSIMELFKASKDNWFPATWPVIFSLDASLHIMV